MDPKLRELLMMLVTKLEEANSKAVSTYERTFHSAQYEIGSEPADVVK
jgi:hypothetical protein